MFSISNNCAYMTLISCILFRSIFNDPLTNLQNKTMNNNTASEKKTLLYHM